MNLSGKIKQLRKENEMTQEQLAEALQVSRSTISSWETGRSYPDLEMVIAICDCFHVSLDFLLREDAVMVKKLNFGIKQKRLLIALIITLVLLLVNAVMSSLTFEANPKQLKVTQMSLIRDHYYKGDDPKRDWNTTIHLEMKATNPFFKPSSDELFVLEKNGTITMQAYWSFSFFNLFDTNRKVKEEQSVFIDPSIPSKKVTVRWHGENREETIPFKMLDTNQE